MTLYILFLINFNRKIHGNQSHINNNVTCGDKLDFEVAEDHRKEIKPKVEQLCFLWQSETKLA